MAGRIPQDFIDNLLARVDIIDLVTSRVPLRKSGQNHVARCPFHDEKTPSFTVNQEKQFFHCFGCGVSGTAIGFLMDFERLSFVEAIEVLAAFAGVDVPYEKGSSVKSDQGANNSKIFDLQEKVANSFHQQLFNSLEGRDFTHYLESRGVDGDIARSYHLGHASSGWHNLSNLFPQDLLERAGLLVTKDNGKSYDRFRGRLMFPIRDRRGRTVGFGGRVIDDSLPKYLNSPETSVFKKGNELYGLYELLKILPKPDRIIVVEGYMDVIALAQAKIHYSVATLGTAVSRNHLETLFRYTSELVFCFDGDNAGRQAAWRALELSLPSLRDGRRVRIMVLPSEHDPDSFVREQGVVRFSESVAQSKLLSDYLFEELTSDLDLTEIEGCSALVNKVKPLIAKLPASAFRDMMVARLNQLVKINALPAEPENKSGPRFSNVGVKQRTKPSPVRTAIALLLQYPDISRSVDVLPDDFKETDMQGVKLLIEVFEILRSNQAVQMSGLIERFRGTVHEQHLKKLAHLDLLLPAQGVLAEFSDALSRIVEQIRERRIAELLNKPELSKDELIALRALL